MSLSDKDYYEFDPELDDYCAECGMYWSRCMCEELDQEVEIPEHKAEPGKSGERMKIGTFGCWLFGHKFIGKSQEYENSHGYVTITKALAFCVRCGALRPDWEVFSKESTDKA